MIAALLLALQVGAAQSVPTITVRTDTRSVRVPMTATAAGPVIRADLLAAAIGARLTPAPNDHWILRVAEVVLDVAPNVPFVRNGDEVYPLASAPRVAEGRLLVPLQLVSDVLPRVAPRVFSFDVDAAQLYVADTVVARVVAPAQPGRGNGSQPRQRMVVVDAGHGGPDNGMSGPIGGRNKVREKEITLAVAARVADILRTRGYGVVMTRTSDTLIALVDRGRIANASKADLFLSIHVNAANPKWKKPANTRGFETYFLAEAKTEDAKRVEQMENEAVRFETGVHAPKGDPLSFIINDMAQNEHLRESSGLAQEVQRALARIHPGPDRGVRQANFAVLRGSFMPAVLIEVGFGTNPSDASILSNAWWQTRIATAVADATGAYLAGYERRVAGPPAR